MKSSKLYQAAAWVVIVAGIVFIVAVVFFSGAALMDRDDHGWHRHHPHGKCQMHDGPMGPGGPPMAPPPAPTEGGPAGPGNQHGPQPTPAVPPGR